MASDFKTAQPLQFYKQFLNENVRPDGRQLLEFRKTFLTLRSINTAAGSALVRIGDTMVVCGITAEVAEPTAEQTDHGFFVPNVELPALCSPEFRPGPPNEKAQVLSQFVLDCVMSSELISLKDLCIVDKKLCYVLYADFSCISHDGNLVDGIMTALYAALRCAKLPLVTINNETGSTELVDGETFEVKLKTKLVSTTFAIFNDGILLVDPTYEEEELSSSTITIVVGDDEQLCSVYKPGGCPISEDLLKKCVQTASNRVHDVDRLLAAAEESIDR